MGANLVADGATFRAWAPAALEVHLKLNADASTWQPDPSALLIKNADGVWGGFVPGVKDGDPYRFYVVGKGSKGYKRDPCARELGQGFPSCDSIVRDPTAYPWHDQGFLPPAFNDLIIYQLHIGTYYAVDKNGNDRRKGRVAKFLDLLDRITYWTDLGINAIQPLPVVEFPTQFSLGYNGTDYFSPEMDYSVPPEDLDPYLKRANELLAARNKSPLTREQLKGQVHQLKALIDICHVYGIGVIIDVVYNHAGGGFDDQSLYFFDRAVKHSNNDSLYFTDQGWAGGLVFAYWKKGVRQFLIDNAKFFVEEYHIDGIRYDEVSVIDRFGGWHFCQELTGTVRSVRPSIPQIAEFWNPDPSWAVRSVPSGGAGFDTVWHDGLRDSIRGILQEAAGGREARVHLDPLKAKLYPPPGFSAAWQTVQFIENHDLLLESHDAKDKKPRIPALADPTSARSWYARSRSRVATGLLLTAPGIPMLFMGQEFLEDKYWSDNPNSPGNFIWWEGLSKDKAMADHLRFTRELARLRRRHPALRGEGLHVFYARDDDRVIAFQRWVEGIGRDVVVVASLNESTFWNYHLGFPAHGLWLEVFNSDVYDNWVNPMCAGNGGSITVEGPPMHDLPHSAAIVIPANSVLVFARDAGD